MSNTKRGKILIAIGTLLLLAALSLVVYNRAADSRGERISRQALAELHEIIPDTPPQSEPDPLPPSIAAPEQPDSEADTDSQAAPQEQSIELDGRWYIGVLEIPAIDLQLPVQSGWNYHNLNIGPCRYYGSVYSGDMIIAAHNYRSFFKRIDELASGDEIVFTTLSGERFVYEVDHTELVGGYDVEGMTAGAEGWDLTLFTCTWSGRSRVTVRAVEKNAA